MTEEEPVILTARNDGMIYSFNSIQLSAWRANVDMQYIVSRNRVAPSMSLRVRQDHCL